MYKNVVDVVPLDQFISDNRTQQCDYGSYTVVGNPFECVNCAYLRTDLLTE